MRQFGAAGVGFPFGSFGTRPEVRPKFVALARGLGAELGQHLFGVSADPLGFGAGGCFGGLGAGGILFRSPGLLFRLWKLTYKWACWSHPNKPKRWIVQRYFGKFNKFRNDRWVFGDRDTGAYLPKPAWTDITRHTLVKGGASPDDPDLADYWARRRRKVKPPLDSYTVRLLSALCGENLLIPDQQPQSPEGWEWWFLWVTKKAIKADYLVHHTAPDTPRGDRTHLVHAT